MEELKFNYKKTIFVGLAFFSITMFWQTYDSLIAKILIDKFGLSQGFSGVIMALDNMLAIFMLPLFGLLSDRTKSKFGRRTPYIVLGTIIAAVTFMSLSFIDNKQTQFVEDLGIVADYELVYEDVITKENPTRADWDLIFIAINDEKLTDRYHNIITDSNGNLYEETRILNSFEQRDIADVYYVSLSDRAWAETKNDPTNLIVFMVVLFIGLIAMSVYRTPAVALMPDVTIRQFRSKANAVINLLGSAGAVVSIGIMTVFGLSNKSYIGYTPAFIATGALMLVALMVFLLTVNENKLVEEYDETIRKHNLIDEPEEEVVTEGRFNQSRKGSLILILISVFLWFMGYNAVISKLSDYAPKQLNMNFTLPLLVAQGAAIVSFIPIGMLSSYFGRKKMILIGVILLTICFGSAFFLTASTGWLLYVVLAFTGIAWATINVNSFPMVVELASGEEVGKYTGYYYTFSMAAQIITPIFSGVLMDIFGRKVLFPYAAFFVVLALVTMIFVKHGDVKPAKTGILESFDVED